MRKNNKKNISYNDLFLCEVGFEASVTADSTQLCYKEALHNRTAGNEKFPLTKK